MSNDNRHLLNRTDPWANRVAGVRTGAASKAAAAGRPVILRADDDPVTVKPAELGLDRLRERRQTLVSELQGIEFKLSQCKTSRFGDQAIRTRLIAAKTKIVGDLEDINARIKALDMDKRVDMAPIVAEILREVRLLRAEVAELKAGQVTMVTGKVEVRL